MHVCTHTTVCHRFVVLGTAHYCSITPCSCCTLAAAMQLSDASPEIQGVQQLNASPAQISSSHVEFHHPRTPGSHKAPSYLNHSDNSVCIDPLYLVIVRCHDKRAIVSPYYIVWTASCGTSTCWSVSRGISQSTGQTFAMCLSVMRQ